jgi:4-amino-4-deoxy-L-arabinose transferase-like glycosyltransferase
VGALALACGLAFAVFAVDGLWRPDAFDYAQIGRELARGNGMSSLQAIYALQLEFLHEHGLLDSAWPNLHRFPLPSVLMAAGFAAFGATDGVVVLYGVLFLAATAALVFAWGREAVSTRVGVAAAFWITANGVMLETACAGLSEPPVLFFFTAALYGMWRLRDAPGGVAFLWPGLALGAAGLARTNAVFVAPLFLLAIGWGSGLRRERGVGMAALGLGVAVMLAPWALRNLLVAGSPFFSLHSFFLLPSGTDPQALKWDLDVPWVRSFVSPLAFAIEAPVAVLRKWIGVFGGSLAMLPTLGGSVGVVLAGLLAAVVSRATPLPRIARLVAACFVLNLALVSLGDFVFDKYHFHFVPAFGLLGAAVLASALERFAPERARMALFALVVLVTANLPAILETGASVRERTAWIERSHMSRVAGAVPANGVILSDQSYAVAWETGRRSIRTHYTKLPDGQRVLGALELSDAYLPIDAVYLSARFLGNPDQRRIVERTLAQVPRFRQEYPQLHTFENGALLFSRARP